MTPSQLSAPASAAIVACALCKDALVAYDADNVNLLYAGSLLGPAEHGVGLRSHFACDKNGSHMELLRSVRAARYGVVASMQSIRAAGELHGASSLRPRQRIAKAPNAGQRWRRTLKAA